MRQPVGCIEVAYHDLARQIRLACHIRGVSDKRTARSIADELVRHVPGTWRYMGID